MSAQSIDAASRYQRLRGFLNADPANLRLALDAAAAAREGLDYKSEREVLEIAAQQHPDNAEVAFTLGTNALVLRDYRKAEACFDSLLAAGDAHQAVRYNLAFARLRLGAHQGVIDALEPYTDDDWAQVPQAHKLYAQAAHFVDDEGLDRSITHMQKYVATAENDAEARGLLALMLFDDDRNDDAEGQIQAALLLSPTEPNALLAQGGIALERQEPRAAGDAFGAVVKNQPANGRAWSGLAFARMLDLDFPGAEKAFALAVEHMPNHIGTWNGLAWLQIVKGDLDGAEKSLQKAMDIDRNFGDTHGGLAVVAAMRGKTDEARLSARRALGLTPDSASARFAETVLQARAGNNTKAREIYAGLVNDKLGGTATVREMAVALMQRRHADGKGGKSKP